MKRIMKASHSRYSVRMAKVSDASTISAHLRAMYGDMGAWDKRKLDRMDGEFREWVRRKLRTGKYRVWLTVDGSGEVVAGAGLCLMEWPLLPWDRKCELGYVLNVYTQRGHRRRGIARMLMKAILAWCRERGLVTVTLHTSRKGRPLYESLGFRDTSEMRLLFGLRQ